MRLQLKSNDVMTQSVYGGSFSPPIAEHREPTPPMGPLPGYMQNVPSLWNVTVETEAKADKGKSTESAGDDKHVAENSEWEFVDNN